MKQPMVKLFVRLRILMLIRKDKKRRPVLILQTRLICQSCTDINTKHPQ